MFTNEHLQSTELIDSNHLAIVNKAEELCGGETEELQKARILFEFVRDQVKYNFAPVLREPADWRASTCLKSAYGFCQQKAVLLAALARAAGIPSGLCFQNVRDHRLGSYQIKLMGGTNIIPFHGLTTLFLNGKWVRVDATQDRQMVNDHSFRLVEFDPNSDCELPSEDAFGKLHYEILENIGCFSDMPDFVIDGILNLKFLQTPEWSAMARKPGNEEPEC